MSEKAVRARRREVRKAFGPEAAAMWVEHDTRLAALEARQRELGQWWVEHGGVALEQRHRLSDARTRLDTFEREHARIRASLWCRLRWLLTGRA